MHINYEKTGVSPRVARLRESLFAKMPEVESARALLVTESYRATESEPIVTRRAKAFAHILDNIPIAIRADELVVGSTTLAPRSCQTYPEFSFAWLEAEFDTLATRSADPFYISEQMKKDLRGAHQYWAGKTTSELATAYMSPEALYAIDHAVFTPGNYFYNGVGHICVQYDKVLRIGYRGIINELQTAVAALSLADADYHRKSTLLRAMILSCKAVIRYANRHAVLAEELAERTSDAARKQELLRIAANCSRVPEFGAESFHEACQSFWFVQQLIQLEGSGHSISPGRFDQYMYPYYARSIKAGEITRDGAQELVDCIWVKLNDLNKVRDAASAEGFAGYSLFQNLIVGGQNEDGMDVTNDLSLLCIWASDHVRLPQPSLSVRVWNGSPHEFLIAAAELTATGIGLPAYYNDEVVIPSLMNRGLSLADARDYCIIGCVEPQKAGKTDGWHDAAFFNMLRPMELVFSNGMSKGELISIQTGEVSDFGTYDEFLAAYEKQMVYCIELLVNANNAIDMAHAARCPLPYLSCMVDNCAARGLTVQEGGAAYNFTGPQGFGIANVADALYAIKTLVFDEKKYTLAAFKQAMADNFGQSAAERDDISELVIDIVNNLKDKSAPSDEEISALIQQKKGGGKHKALLDDINALPKFGNDVPEVDVFARAAAYTYTRPMETYKNPRGGMFQAGLYPVSANVPLGAQTGATPDGRLAGVPVADGVSPAAGRDVNGPTAAANSVARLDHGIASNGTLFNQKFHPSALKGRAGLENFVALLRSFFDQKGSHMQFNVVSREVLEDAQKNPENHCDLIVRVAGYSALFTTLSRSLQDDIISRTEQGF